jgi:hypothetical protein
MRRIDPSQIKIVINGNTVKPGSPDAPPIPDVRTFSQKLIFSGNFAREIQEAPAMMIRRLEGTPGEMPNGPTQRIAAPFTESRYLDLTQKKVIRVLEVKKDSVNSIYLAEDPFPMTNNWKETNKTRKVAGYTCQKATCHWKGEEYTIWYTTELPFTYSPITALMPAQGVVLLVESNNQSFKASGVAFSNIPETEVKPTLNAHKVSGQELDKLRDKAMADFHQRTFSNGPFNKQ